MSTRGRANVIRAALERREISDPLVSEELDAALGNCLSCRACVTECPSNVNLPLLKAEMLHARIRRDGLTLRDRMLSSVDGLGRLGCAMPRTANAVLRSGIFRATLGRLLGLAPERALPAFAKKRFDRWFAKHQNVTTPTRGQRGRFGTIRGCATTLKPNIGMAAVAVLEAAGFEDSSAGQTPNAAGHWRSARKFGRSGKMRTGKSRRAGRDWAMRR